MPFPKIIGIVQPPTSQLILPGMNATFNCVTTEGTSSWTVNGMPVNVGNEWQYRGVTFTIDENIDPASGYILTVLTLRVEGRAINNGSQVQCYSAYANVDVSNPVSLIIAGELYSMQTYIRKKMKLLSRCIYSNRSASCSEFSFDCAELHSY